MATRRQQDMLDKKRESLRSRARDRLTGALNNAATISEEKEKEKAATAKKGSPTKAAPKTPKSEKTAPEKPAQTSAAIQANQSYIMKLFDRSVNLAKFDESTPLYPIVRDWLKNTPRQKTILDVKKEKKPDIKPEIVGKDDVTEMPKVVLTADACIFEKPEVKPDLKAVDELDFSKPNLTKQEILELNKKRWSASTERRNEQYKKFKMEHFGENLKTIQAVRVEM